MLGMKNKRGVSPLLAAVILVAFAVALGGIVSNIVLKQAAEFDPEKLAESSVHCESVSLGYDIDDFVNFGIYARDIPGSDDEFHFVEQITLVNRGSFSIHRLIVNTGGTDSTDYLIDNADNKLKPGADNRYNISIYINPNDDDKRIKFVPIIKDIEKDIFVRCPDRQLIINYSQICADLFDGNPECPPH